MLYKKILYLMVALSYFPYVKSCSLELKKAIQSGYCEAIEHTLDKGEFFANASELIEAFEDVLKKENVETSYAIIQMLLEHHNKFDAMDKECYENGKRLYPSDCYRRQKIKCLMETLLLAMKYNRADLVTFVLQKADRYVDVHLLAAVAVKDLLEEAKLYEAGDAAVAIINAYAAPEKFLHGCTDFTNEARSQFIKKILRTSVKKQLNEKDYEGKTPLHKAVQKADANPVLRVLVEECEKQNGWLFSYCSLNLIDNGGYTILDLARKYKNTGSEAFLKKHKARCNRECEPGEKPVFTK